jgi:hypothetical protein
MAFSFAHCPDCGRLIHGATCVCAPNPTSRCDCTFDGNKQNIGPECHRRMMDVWSDAIRRSRELARNLSAGV